MGQRPSRITHRTHSGTTTEVQKQAHQSPDHALLKHGPNIQAESVDCQKQNRNKSNNLGSRSGPSYSTVTPTVTSPTSTGTRRGRRTRKTKDRLCTFPQESEVVFVVDDSTSMLGERWQEAEDVLAGIAQRYVQYNPDGIDIYFVNHRYMRMVKGIKDEDEEEEDEEEEYQGPGPKPEPEPEPEEEDQEERGRGLGGYTKLKTAEEVGEVFRNIEPRGPTPFANRLCQILEPYLRLVEDKAMDRLFVAQRAYENNNNKNDDDGVKPLCIVALTDGAFTDDAEKVLEEAARRLEGSYVAAGQVRLQFFQVGSDEGARRFLEALEGNWRKEILRQIMIDTVPGEGGRLNADGILKSVLSKNRNRNRR